MSAVNGRTAVESGRPVRTHRIDPVRLGASTGRRDAAGSGRLVTSAAQILERVLAADLLEQTGMTLRQLAQQWSDDRGRERGERHEQQRTDIERFERELMLHRLDRLVYRCSCGQWRTVPTLERVRHECPRCSSQQGGTGTRCRLPADHGGDWHVGGQITQRGYTYTRRWST